MGIEPGLLSAWPTASKAMSEIDGDSLDLPVAIARGFMPAPAAAFRHRLGCPRFRHRGAFRKVRGRLHPCGTLILVHVRSCLDLPRHRNKKMGRASCRERVCQNV